MAGKQPKRASRPGVDGYGRTPVHYAAGDGRADEVERLLAEGASPNLQDDDGWSPLHFAAQAHSVDCVRLLLEAGANPELKDGSGNSPLWRATFASRGRGEVIRLLRSAGADPKSPNNHGVSPVSLAHTIGNYDVAQHFADVE